MPKLFPIMSSFAAGETTPRFRLRADTAVYKNGVEIMENFISTSHGPARKRGGSLFVSTTPGDGGSIYPFEVSTATGFIVTFIKTSGANPARLEVNDEGGATQTPASEQLVNPNMDNAEPDWPKATSNDGTVSYSSGKVILFSRFAAISQTVVASILDVGDEVQFSYNVKSGPFIDPVVPELRVTIDFTGGDSFTFDHGLNTSSKQRTQVFTLTQGGANQGFTVTFQNRGFGTNYTINSASVTGTTTQEGVSFDLTLASGNVSADWDDDDITNLQIDAPSGDDAIYITTPRKPVTKLSYDVAANLWTFGEVAFTNPPVEWSATSNPGAICFFQGRLWFGGSPDDPETFWGSKSNNFEDFNQGTGTGDDAVTFTLDQKGIIRWMRGAKNLVIGTSTNEFIVTGDTGGETVAGDNVRIERQSSFGSAPEQAIQVGNKILYISPDGRKVREIGFEWTDEQWVSRDLTFNSEHITDFGRELIRIQWAQNPDTILIGIGLSGEIITATYERSYDIIGWHRQKIAGPDPANPAQALDTTVLRKDGIDELWVLFRRNQAGLEGDLFLEKFNANTFLDSSSAFDFDAGKSDTFTMAHLPNQTVQVLTRQLVNGVLQAAAIHPPVTLDANGEGKIDYEASFIEAGFGYDSKILTMPVDQWSETGAMRPHMMHWNKIYVAINASRMPLINGERPAERTPASLMDTGEPLRTEYIKVQNLGHDRDEQVEIIQDLPFECEVLGIFGELADDPM